MGLLTSPRQTPRSSIVLQKTRNIDNRRTNSGTRRKRDNEDCAYKSKNKTTLEIIELMALTTTVESVHPPRG